MISESTPINSVRPRPARQRSGPLRRNVNLTRELAVTSFKLKYTGSVLGYAWSLVNPLLIFGMTYVVFALFLLRGRTTAGENFPVELLLGIVVWSFFAEATGSAVGAIVANGHIVRKAYFPRWIVVVAATLSSVMTLVVNLLLILVIGIVFGWFNLGLHSLIAIPLLIEMYLFVLGIAMLLSALFVYFRDLGHVWTIMLQFLFYASAIVFPFSLVPTRFQTLVAFNPTAQIVEDMRRALVTTSIPWSSQILGSLLVVPIGVVVLSMVGGYLVFRRLSPRFGEAL